MIGDILMLKYVILWVMVNNQPQMVRVFHPINGTMISIARDSDAVLNCEAVARDIRAWGERAWCVPQLDF